MALEVSVLIRTRSGLYVCSGQLPGIVETPGLFSVASFGTAAPNRFMGQGILNYIYGQEWRLNPFDDWNL